MKKNIYHTILFCCCFLSVQAQNKVDEYKKIIAQSTNKKEVSKAYISLVDYYSIKKFDSCIFFAREGIQLSTINKDFTTVGVLQKNIGKAFYFKGTYDSAAVYFFKSIEVLEKQQAMVELGYALNELARLFRKKRELEKALNYYDKALNIFTNLKDSTGIATILNESGVVYEYQEKYEEAIKKYEASLAIQTKKNDSIGISYSLSFIAGVYLIQKKYELAEKYNYQVLAIRKQLKDSFALALTYADMGSIFLEKKEYAKAIENFTLSNNIATSIQYSELLSSTYLQLSAIANNQNNFKEAYTYYQQHIQLKDSIFNLASTQAIADIATKYETAKKETQIQQQEFEIKKRNFWIIGIIVLSILLSLLGYSFYRRYKLKKEKQLQEEIFKQQENATKAILEAEENERKRIARDLHDGVGQLMSAAKMNLSALEAEIPFANNEQKKVYEKVLQLVDDSCKEVRTVSHNMMPNALLKAGLASAIREFLNQIDIRVIKIDLYTEGLNERLDIAVETVLYRVIQECVNNVIKHAEANHLDISLIKDVDGISATIEDNGKGFDSSNENMFEGIGLKNIKTRVEYLKGTVEWNSDKSKGTLVAIHVPLL